MAKTGEEKTYTTFDGRTITNIDALLREPKVQEQIKKLRQHRNLGPNERDITVLRYRKPE